MSKYIILKTDTEANKSQDLLVRPLAPPLAPSPRCSLIDDSREGWALTKPVCQRAWWDGKNTA